MRVLGTACGLAIEGSGWVAAPDLVVTNAHVVAGENDTTVEVGRARHGAGRRTGRCTTPTDDIAVLRVRGLGLPALSRAGSVASGASGAILGYPENGPFDAEAARIGRTQRVSTQNAYGQGPVHAAADSAAGAWFVPGTQADRWSTAPAGC